MKIIDQEVDVREQSATSNPSSLPKKPHPKLPPTAAALMTSSSGPVRCAFCEQGHASSSCTVVTDISARKEALCKSGRCYVCLRAMLAEIVGPQDVVTNAVEDIIIPFAHARMRALATPPTMSPGPVTEGQEGAVQASGGAHRPTNVTYVDSQTPILLQTARLQLYNLNNVTAPPTCVEARAIMDSGSQRTCVTSRLRESLHLPMKRTEG